MVSWSNDLGMIHSPTIHMAFLCEIKLLPIQPITYSSPFSLCVGNLFLLEVLWGFAWNVRPRDIINMLVIFFSVASKTKGEQRALLLLVCLWFFGVFCVVVFSHVTYSIHYFWSLLLHTSYYLPFNFQNLYIQNLYSLFTQMFIIFTGYWTQFIHIFPKVFV